MNIHHLELFYYVARHGGIVPAVRNMPYGIQQPAVSGQIARLEESLGTKLFNRRPFALLPSGMELYEFIRPFFDEIDHVGEAIRGGSAHQLTVIEHKKASEIRSRALLELPLILLVKGTQRLTRADQLWGRDKIEETLITFRRSDPVSIHFQLGLEQLGVEWFPGIEVNSARLIECYVAHGYGIGLTVATPGFKAPKGIRALKLTNFPKVMIGAAWTGKLSAIAQQFLAEVEIEARFVKRSTKLR